MQCKASTRHPKCRLHITYIVNVPLGRLILLKKNVLLPTPHDPQQILQEYSLITNLDYFSRALKIFMRNTSPKPTDLL